jgi:hypothetical protein
MRYCNVLREGVLMLSRGRDREELTHVPVVHRSNAFVRHRIFIMELTASEQVNQRVNQRKQKWPHKPVDLVSC